MENRPQSAVQGILSAATANAAARLIGYSRALLVATSVGLSASLDAFYMAGSVLGLCVYTFGDAFDSLGIPRLVNAVQESGEEGFRKAAGTIMAFAVALSMVLCTLLLVLSPAVLSLLAPGFSPEKRAMTLRSLALLSPVALLYLPYHAAGSFLRARRRFREYYTGEIVAAGTSLVVFAAMAGRDGAVPLSVSAGFVAGFAWVSSSAFGDMILPGRLWVRESIAMSSLMIRLLPLYATGHAFLLVDRIFASYLPTGSISALSYAMMIVAIPSSVLAVDSVCLTPLAESRGDKATVDRLFSGVVLLAVPVAIFTAAYPAEIVRLLLKGGAFGSAEVALTGSALRVLALSVPTLFLSPLCYRLFQIHGMQGAATRLSAACVAANAAMNLAFMKAGMGIVGLVLATSACWTIGLAGMLAILRRDGIYSPGKTVAGAALNSAAAGTVAVLLVGFLPEVPWGKADTLMRGFCFVLLVAATLYIAGRERGDRGLFTEIRRAIRTGT